MASYDAYVGDTRAIALVARRDAVVVDLTGATFAARADKPDGSRANIAASQFAITSATAGNFTWTPVAATLDVVGGWMLYVSVTIAASPFSLDPFEVSIGPRGGAL